MKLKQIFGLDDGKAEKIESEFKLTDRKRNLKTKVIIVLFLNFTYIPKEYF